MEYAEEDIYPSALNPSVPPLPTRLRDGNTCRNHLRTSHAMHSRQGAISLDPRMAAFFI